MAASLSVTPGAASPPALAIHNIQVVYGGAIEAVRDVSLEVRPGQIVALLGSNGAGKSTVLKAVSGVLDAEAGEIEKGSILLHGHAVEHEPAPAIVRRGMVQVPEGRRLFATLTVEENLIAGAHLQDAATLERTRESVFTLFPRLRSLRQTISGYLSGGEQQMVAIGRALMSAPDILLLDEPSLGLSPLMARELFAALGQIRTAGTGILLVEQNARASLRLADRGYLLANGHLSASAGAAALRDDPAVQHAYLGATPSLGEITDVRSQPAAQQPGHPRDRGGDL